MSVKTNLNHLFDNKGELINIIINNKDSYFKNTIVSDDFIKCMTDYFINNENKLSRNAKKHREFLTRMLSIMANEICIDNIDSIYTKQSTIVGKGTYATVFDYDNKVVKLLRARINSNEYVFDLSDPVSEECFLMFILDLFTYITWSAILTYIDNMNNSDTVKTEIQIMMRKYLYDIHDIFICFVKTKDGIDNTKFYMGYTMEKYNTTLSSYLRNYSNNLNVFKHDKPSTDDFMNKMANISFMLYHIKKLNERGIYLIHRDTSTSNILFDNDGNVKLIDVGLALTHIKFKDSTTWYFGTFYDIIYDHIIEPLYDVIFLMLFMIVYHSKVLKHHKIYYHFTTIIAKYANEELIDLKSNTALWGYPYKAKYINRVSVFNHFMSLFDKNGFL